MTAAELALSWVGTPYVHQGRRKGAGADCLGLVIGVWHELTGTEPAEIPPYSMDWAEPSHDEVLLGAARSFLSEKPVREAAPGDVLLFRMHASSIAKHLGILTEAGPHPRFVHAYSTHGVVLSSLSEPWRRRVAAVFSFPSN